ncbi:MAG TPA: alanine racemase [Gemmatimonadaceae bacterium]|nr:alanine racemase [Gemmatimonadaceae bacterium]
MTGQSLPAHAARAWIDIDLGALVRNGAALMRRAGAPLLPMVKADAYGLGAVPVARALERLAPWGFGVATVAEGAELRAAGITRPVVVFTPLLPRDLAAALAAELTPTLFRAEDIRAWAPSGRPWHLAIETGMNRAGVPWTQVGALADVLRAHPPEGAFTHFHSADHDDGSRQQQEQRLRDALATMPARPPLVHAENSAALERAAPSAWNVVRPGVFLYGVGSGEGSQLQPEPVVSMRARVVDIHDLTEGETVSYGARYQAHGSRRVATLAVGYADGYRRALSLRGPVLVNGREVRVAGVVTMDMTMIDVTDVPCAVGDVATLIGRDGQRVLTVEIVARAADLSPYELLTGLRGRLPRIYAGPAE